MARHGLLRPGLLLCTLVLVAHIVAMDWVAGHLAPLSALRDMAPAMYTRTLRPQAPPPPAAAAVVDRTPARPKPRTVRLADENAAPTEVATTPPEPGESVGGAAPAPGVPTDPADTVAQAPQEPASAASASDSTTPVTPAAAPMPGDQWPGDTRLSYRLGGRFRSGELYGDARVSWQREGARYQVRVDIDITPWATLAMTSQGDVSTQGLVPRVFEETRPGKRRVAQMGDTTVTLDNGRSVPRPAGLQDTASQFVELSHRFATGKETLEVGRTVTFWMARPGGVDEWVYDIVQRETLLTPKLGAVEAFHLKPRPQATPRGNITAEMWFAPSLQFLPVRIRVNMGEEAHVDLLVDEIQQR